MAKLSQKTQMTTGGPVFVYVDEEKDKIIGSRRWTWIKTMPSHGK